jgi:hypothetical protein
LLHLDSILVLYSEVVRLLWQLYEVKVEDEIKDYAELHTSWLPSYPNKKDI